MKLKFYLSAICLCLMLSKANAQLENYDTLISQYLTAPPESGFMLFQTPNYFPPSGLFQIYKDSTGDMDNNMKLVSNHTDNLIHFHHYKYKQTYKGLEVEGAGCIEHFDPNWSLAYTQSKLATQLDMDVKPSISSEGALDAFFDQMGSEIEYAWNDSTTENQLKDMSNDANATHYPIPELLLTIDNYHNVLHEIPASRYTLAYKIHVVTVNPYQSKDYYLDAHTGIIIKSRNVGDKRNGTCGAYGYGTNNSIDTEWSGFHQKWLLEAHDNLHFFETRWRSTLNREEPWDNCARRKDADDDWGNVYLTSTSAHFFTQTAWDYFKTEFGRNGMDNSSGELQVRVHLSEANAYFKYHPVTWTVPRISFGSLNGFDFSWEPSFVAHEYTHGVAEFTSGFIYEHESGALDESFADIFGIVIQSKMLDNNVTDYILGNHITLPLKNTRSLVSPHSRGTHFTGYSGTGYNTAVGQPSTYLGVNWYSGADTAVDKGGVHMNSGVQNHMFYILSNGAFGTNDNNDYYYVTGIGLDDASKIAYYAMTTLMNCSQYSDSRMAWIQASINLFGYCSQQHKSTVDAWYAVGIGNHSSCPSLSVEDLSQIINIYPNPANTVFSISTNGLNLTNDIKIYSINGSLVKTISPNDVMKIDISDLSSGTYIVRASVNDKVISKKIIIQGNE